jgi:hypothetical protein
MIYNVGYQGGSGGFILLHFLLLSEKYHTCFDSNYDFKNILERQWNISNASNWKDSEFRPDNYSTTISEKNNKNKLLYFCNPDRDNFFNFNPFIKRNPFINFKKNYCNVKDPSWPNINSFDDFLKLPKKIQDEVINDHKIKNIGNYFEALNDQKTYIWLYTDINSQNELAWYKKAYFYFNEKNKEKITNVESYATLWNGTLVDTKSVYFLEHSNIQIKLQDWVNKPDLLVDYQLIEKVSQSQIDLLNHWKKLHPPELLKLIGIK